MHFSFKVALLNSCTCMCVRVNSVNPTYSSHGRLTENVNVNIKVYRAEVAGSNCAVNDKMVRRDLI